MSAGPSGSSLQRTRKHAAMCDSRYAASPMSLQMARRCAAIWSLNDAGMTPGASSRSSVPASRTHCSMRVTPGLGADAAARRPTRRLMSADLPMLGNPMTHVRTGRGCRPRLARLALMPSLTLSSASLTPLAPSPFLPSVQNTCCLVALKYSFHACLSALDTMSTLFMMSRRGLWPTHVDTWGWLVATGIRASRTSSTTSTILSCSFSCRSARAMCPGYHCTICT
mmetsp:Transcript_32723/g.83019  ORF Transcript_32723/g.83019 Transcript_32723/m.83019 type:complete len:225 (+) Transcript_32723:391-1065(+)